MKSYLEEVIKYPVFLEKFILLLLAICLPQFNLQGYSEPSASSQIATPKISETSSSGSVQAPEGHILVSWSLPTPPQQQMGTLSHSFELQYDVYSDFAQPHTRLVGADTSTFLSGLPEGDVYIRLRSIRQDGVKSSWSVLLIRFLEVSMR
jgi:hypothetical protein